MGGKWGTAGNGGQADSTINVFKLLSLLLAPCSQNERHMFIRLRDPIIERQQCARSNAVRSSEELKSSLDRQWDSKRDEPGACM